MEKLFENIDGVPKFSCKEYDEKRNKYCLCIPIINEGDRIKKELTRAKNAGVNQKVDIVICDAGSTDGSTDDELLKSLGVNTLLIKQDKGKQGAQLRMGFWWALERGYEGIITIDGNNKDSIEDVPKFIEKLDEKTNSYLIHSIEKGTTTLVKKMRFLKDIIVIGDYAGTIKKQIKVNNFFD